MTSLMLSLFLVLFLPAPCDLFSVRFINTLIIIIIIINKIQNNLHVFLL